jgi:hypothetical protein
MKRNPFRNMHDVTGPAIFAAASFLLLWPFARLDFDRYHDGYMLAQAMAVHQGASVHADVFAQYGPVTPWLQSVALFLPIGPGLALRTINVAFIAVTVFLLADMGRRGPRNWPVSRAVGWWAAVAWFLLADVWIGIPMLPWSSTLGALLSVATLYLFTRSMRSAEDGSIRAASTAALASGALLGLIPFTRITVGLSAVAVCLVVAALVISTEEGVKRAAVRLFVLGVFLSFCSVIGILAVTGSLADFYTQAVRWPLTWSQAATENSHTQAYLTSIFVYQGPPVALACAAVLLQSRARTFHRRWPVTRSGANVLTVLVGLIIVGWENLRIFLGGPGQSLLRSLVSPSNEYIYFFMVLSVVASVLTCVIAFFRYFFRDRATGRHLVGWLLLGGLALSGLTQSVPVFDPKHVWWAAPIGLLLVFSVVRATSQLNSPSGNPLILPVVATVVMATVSAFTYLGLPRVHGQPGTIVEGMLVSRARSTQISEDTAFLGRQLQGSTAVVYLVDDGDLSVLDGRYRSADSFFVSWGPTPQVQTRIDDGNPIVVQTSAFAEARINDLARSINYQVIARNQRLVVLRPRA